MHSVNCIDLVLVGKSEKNDDNMQIGFVVTPDENASTVSPAVLVCFAYDRNVTHKFQGINVEAALVFDAVHLLASALQELDAEKEDVDVIPQQISCNGEAAWAHGNALISYMKITKLQV